jgi:hypothetical protein
LPEVLRLGADVVEPRRAGVVVAEAELVGQVAGDSVSSFATDIPKSTAFLVDGKYLLIYRADYDIIPTGMITSAR